MVKIEARCFKTIEYQRVIVHDIKTTAIVGTGYVYYVYNEDKDRLDQNLNLNKVFSQDEILPSGNYAMEFDDGGIAVLPARIQ